MLFFIFDKHLMYSRSDGRGGVISYYYYDAVTWVSGRPGAGLDYVVFCAPVSPGAGAKATAARELAR